MWAAVLTQGWVAPAGWVRWVWAAVLTQGRAGCGGAGWVWAAVLTQGWAAPAGGVEWVWAAVLTHGRASCDVGWVACGRPCSHRGGPRRLVGCGGCARPCSHMAAPAVMGWVACGRPCSHRVAPAGRRGFCGWWLVDGAGSSCGWCGRKEGSLRALVLEAT